MSAAIDPARDRAIAARNARTVARADAAANVLVQLIAGIALVAFGLWAVFTYMEPCAEATLCMVAVVTPTRTGAIGRLLGAWRGAYLRVLIRSAEHDVEHHAQMADLAPQLERLARQRLGELRVELMSLASTRATAPALQDAEP